MSASRNEPTAAQIQAAARAIAGPELDTIDPLLAAAWREDARKALIAGAAPAKRGVLGGGTASQRARTGVAKLLRAPLKYAFRFGLWLGKALIGSN